MSTGRHFWGKSRLGYKADNLTAISDLLRGQFYLLYVDDVRTSHETHVWASTAYYRNSFTVLYVDYVRTSHETHVWVSTAYYRNSFTVLYVDDVRTSQQTRLQIVPALLSFLPLCVRNFGTEV
jgi:hypothetical protein